QRQRSRTGHELATETQRHRAVSTPTCAEAHTADTNASHRPAKPAELSRHEGAAENASRGSSSDAGVFRSAFLTRAAAARRATRSCSVSRCLSGGPVRCAAIHRSLTDISVTDTLSTDICPR